MEMTKERMKNEVARQNNISFFVLNVSSVICPHETMTRPFVFRHTNADPAFWLMPHEVAERVVRLTVSEKTGFVEDELFHSANYYEEEYFSDDKFTNRKKAELGYGQ